MTDVNEPGSSGASGYWEGVSGLAPEAAAVPLARVQRALRRTHSRRQAPA